MIQIVPQLKVLVACEPVDFRKGIDSLACVCRQQFQLDPFLGTLFVFRNRSGTALKFLVYDGQGFWLFQKRFSKGRRAARFHFAMAHRLPFGACVVLGPITAMTISLSFPFPLLSVSRDVPSSACSRLDDSGIVERGELSRAEPGKLPREALLSIDALPGGAAQPARPSSTTPSSRRNSRTSGYTRHRFTGFASLLCRSIRPRPVVDPTSIQFAAR